MARHNFPFDRGFHGQVVTTFRWRELFTAGEDLRQSGASADSVFSGFRGCVVDSGILGQELRESLESLHGIKYQFNKFTFVY